MTDDERGPVAADMLDDGAYVGRQTVFVVTRSRARRRTDAAKVGRDDPESIAQSLDHMSPLIPGLREAMNENERRSVASRYVVQRYAVSIQSMVLEFHGSCFSWRCYRSGNGACRRKSTTANRRRRSLIASVPAPISKCCTMSQIIRARCALSRWQLREGRIQLCRRSRSALLMTEMEERLIARAAISGLNNQPVNGYSTPAAIGMPSAL